MGLSTSKQLQLEEENLGRALAPLAIDICNAECLNICDKNFIWQEIGNRTEEVNAMIKNKLMKKCSQNIEWILGHVSGDASAEDLLQFVAQTRCKTKDRAIGDSDSGVDYSVVYSI